MVNKKRQKIGQGIALAALILNILVLPGLGTLIAGRKDPGITQIVLAIISLPLMLLIIGIPLMIGVWIWGLITGIELVRESDNNN